MRSLAVFGTVVVFFPVWIGLMIASHHGIAWFERAGSLSLPGWLKHGYYMALFGVVLVGLGYRVAAWLDRRYPDSQPRSAAWEDANRNDR